MFAITVFPKRLGLVIQICEFPVSAGKNNSSSIKLLSTKYGFLTSLSYKDNGAEIIKKIPPKLKKQINNVSNSYRIYYNQYDPIIYTKINEDHIELQIRYLIHPKKARYVESIISSDILLAYKNGEIEIYK